MEDCCDCCLGGGDYEPVVELLLIFNAESESSNFIDIALLSDNTTEETEIFSVLASSSDRSVSFRVNETLVSIIDNDSKEMYKLPCIATTNT